MAEPIVVVARDPGRLPPRDDVPRDGAGAHRQVAKHVVPAAHAEALVAASVDRPDDEIVVFALPECVGRGFDWEVGRVGVDDDRPLVVAGR